MLPSVSAPTSAYERLMRDAVSSYASEGVLEFTGEALAHRMGRQVTSAFRRHLGGLCADGTLTRYEYFTERGGRGVAYAIGGRAASERPF